MPPLFLPSNAFHRPHRKSTNYSPWYWRMPRISSYPPHVSKYTLGEESYSARGTPDSRPTKTDRQPCAPSHQKHGPTTTPCCHQIPIPLPRKTQGRCLTYQITLYITLSFRPISVINLHSHSALHVVSSPEWDKPFRRWRDTPPSTSPPPSPASQPRSSATP